MSNGNLNKQSEIEIVLNSSQIWHALGFVGDIRQSNYWQFVSFPSLYSERQPKKMELEIIIIFPWKWTNETLFRCSAPIQILDSGYFRFERDFNILYLRKHLVKLQGRNSRYIMYSEGKLRDLFCVDVILFTFWCSPGWEDQVFLVTLTRSIY